MNTRIVSVPVLLAFLFILSPQRSEAGRPLSESDTVITVIDEAMKSLSNCSFRFVK
jgi:hypothetical protein